MSIFEDASKEFVKEAEKKLGKRLLSLTLYGSVIKGRAGRESDIDILAVVSDKEAKEILFEISFEIGLKYDVLFSIISLMPKEYERLEQLKSPYLVSVKEEGQVLYGSV